MHDFISEGDSPSFLYLLNFNGLRSAENPTYGGWGGRFTPNATGWIDTTDVNPDTGAADRAYPQTRWVADLQNDFAARAQWGVTPRYRDANHNPTASVREGLNLRAKAAQAVTLHGRGWDPDGNQLTYRWWEYTYAGTVAMTSTTTPTTSFRIPTDAKPGDTIHLILEVTDNGTPPLKHYQRVILTVK
ncbi:nucleoside hydrolase-like domain-containing protein [Actinoplanes sp. NPDC051411]|uniref:nucleoside hydrolase-like domain-containing protein n=1 Tax=Actinoplanes sp. NPDC051411 TaxID=3155522 RepID=UPI00343572F8